MSRSIFVAGDSNLKQLGCLLNLPNLFLLTVPGAKLVGDVTNFKSKVLDVVRAQKPDLLILHIGSNDVGKDVGIFTSCYRDFIRQLLEMNPMMLVTVCGILPRTTSNFKSFHWNSTVLPDLQRGCAALNDVIMSLSQECDNCHFIDYNPLFDRSMHLARDGLHVNINGAYVLKTVLESFVVSLDMEQINSTEKLLSLDLDDTRMSYADVVKQFPPRDKLKSMDYKDKESCVFSKKPFPNSEGINDTEYQFQHKLKRLEHHEIIVHVSEDVAVILPPTAIHNIYKDQHIHAACTHQKPKLKRFIQKIIPAKVFCCPECRVKCTKEDFLLNHYLSRHVPHRKKMEEIMYKDASFKPSHMKDKMTSQMFQATHKRKRFQLEEEEEDRNISLQTEVQTVFENRLENHPDGAENSCAYCSKEIPVTNTSSLQSGQHISLRSQSTAGFGKPYRHHAIIKETILCEGNSAELRLIHFDKQNGKIKIYESIESYDITIHELCIITYIHPRNSPEKIIRRAEEVLKECGEGKFAKYNLLKCNCEHFATWCVVEKDESFQVQTLRVVIEKILKFVSGGNGKITNFLLKALFLSSDEIASAMTSATVTPVGILAGSVIAYCIYCIYFTVSLREQYFKDRAICKSCLRKKLVKLWAQFAVYIGTSAMTFYLQRYVLPLLTPTAGIPLLVLLLVASTALFIIIPLMK